MKIPPGVKDGARIKLAGRGEPGPGRRAARRPVRAREGAGRTRLFGRKGDDLTLDLPVTYPRPRSGAQVAGAHAERAGDAEGAGRHAGRQDVPRPRQGCAQEGGGHGDLLATVKVDVPRKLSREEKELLKQLQDAQRSRTRRSAPRGGGMSVWTSATRSARRARRLHDQRGGRARRRASADPADLRAQGLLQPKRTQGNTRRYSQRDIEQLRRIQDLTQERREPRRREDHHGDAGGDRGAPTAPGRARAARCAATGAPPRAHRPARAGGLDPAAPQRARAAVGATRCDRASGRPRDDPARSGPRSSSGCCEDSLPAWAAWGADPKVAARQDPRAGSSAPASSTEHGLDLGIEVDGRLVGDVQARRGRTAAGGVRARDRPVRRARPRARVRPRGGRAWSRRTCSTTLGARRVQLTTDVGERGDAARGRSASASCTRAISAASGPTVVRDDGGHDYAMYGMTRADYGREGMTAMDLEQADDEVAGRAGGRAAAGRRAQPPDDRARARAVRAALRSRGGRLPAAAPPRRHAEDACATASTRPSTRSRRCTRRAARSGWAPRPARLLDAAGARGRAAHRRVHLHRAPAARDARRRRRRPRACCRRPGVDAGRACWRRSPRSAAASA